MDEAVARLAVLDALPPHLDVADRAVSVTFIRCLGLHWPRGRPRPNHVGTHPEIVWAYANHDAMREIARACFAYGLPCAPGNVHVLAFWCHAGERRSVCAAELLSRDLARKNRAHSVLHSCRQLWGRRSCGGCRERGPNVFSARREDARARFAALMDTFGHAP